MAGFTQPRRHRCAERASTKDGQAPLIRHQSSLLLKLHDATRHDYQISAFGVPQLWRTSAAAGWLRIWRWRLGPA
jgi:hypothetical protein